MKCVLLIISKLNETFLDSVELYSCLKLSDVFIVTAEILMCHVSLSGGRLHGLPLSSPKYKTFLFNGLKTVQNNNIPRKGTQYFVVELHLTLGFQGAEKFIQIYMYNVGLNMMS